MIAPHVRHPPSRLYRLDDEECEAREHNGRQCGCRKCVRRDRQETPESVNRPARRESDCNVERLARDLGMLKASPTGSSAASLLVRT